ncbi:hypothetical protein [Methylobacterium planeticum]|uniref:DUF3035 domain-containing protein n=1 Tax=Methylobacterium planeticum TaxID=2615211 RepID=A0A6N6MMK2_9HYPH|nr:hypothetical protein [Methylobacterium planeticum]KAB1070480.1 hypothetical protein F6X51_22370 [Methylobacterium planeticum]
MRILRLLAVGAVVAASTGIVGFTCVDRLAHLQPAPRLARALPLEPSATGSILPDPGFGEIRPGEIRPTGTRPGEARPGARAAEAKLAALPPKPAAPKIPNGFDTERLNALMRGDPIAPVRR